MKTQVLSHQDKEEILLFEKKKLASSSNDPANETFISWQASWRPESLDYYLPLGWSMGLRQEQILVGYFLAQTQLFTQGLSQSLWIEHLGFHQISVGKQLVQTAYKLSREKHLQRVLFSNISQKEIFEDLSQKPQQIESTIFIKTSKYQ